MRWFGEGALEKYPLGQLAGVLLYFMHRSGAAVGGAIRLSTVTVHDRVHHHRAKIPSYEAISINVTAVTLMLR